VCRCSITPGGCFGASVDGALARRISISMQRWPGAGICSAFYAVDVTPLAIMLSADRVPDNFARSEAQCPRWVVPIRQIDRFRMISWFRPRQLET